MAAVFSAVMDAWVDRHRPQKLREIVGNRDQIVILHQWLKEYKAGTAIKIAMMSGPPGVGKSTIVRLVMDKLSFEAITIDGDSFATEKRGSGQLSRTRIGELVRNQTMGGRTPCIVIEGVEGCDGKVMTELIALARVPLVGICADYDKKTKKIKDSAACLKIELKRPGREDVVRFLEQVLRKEGLRTPKERLRELVVEVDCNIRRCLNELYFRVGVGGKALDVIDLSHRKSRTCFQAAQHLFATPKRGGDSNTLQAMVECTRSDDMVPLLVLENYLQVGSSLEDACAAADSVSLSDTMFAKVDGEICSCMGTVLPARLCATRASVLPRFQIASAAIFSTAELKKKTAMAESVSAQMGMRHPCKALVTDILPACRHMTMILLDGYAKSRAKKSYMKTAFAPTVMAKAPLSDTVRSMFELQCAEGNNWYVRLPANTKAAFTRIWGDAATLKKK